MEYEILLLCNSLGLVIIMLIVLYHFIGTDTLDYLSYSRFTYIHDVLGVKDEHLAEQRIQLKEDN